MAASARNIARTPAATSPPPHHSPPRPPPARVHRSRRSSNGCPKAAGPYSMRRRTPPRTSPANRLATWAFFTESLFGGAMPHWSVRPGGHSAAGNDATLVQLEKLGHGFFNNRKLADEDYGAVSVRQSAAALANSSWTCDLHTDIPSMVRTFFRASTARSEHSPMPLMIF